MLATRWRCQRLRSGGTYRFATRTDAKAAIISWVTSYNNVRLHSTLGYGPPIEWELHYRLTQQQVA
jgi:putative transposase